MASPLFQRLTEHFMKFPGIGPRQARRFVYYLLQTSENSISKFIEDIKELRQNFVTCEQCQRFYEIKDKKKTAICNLCSSQERDNSVLMLLEKNIDLENMEKAGVFRGRYFILGGLIPLVDPKPTNHFRTAEVLEKIKSQKGLKEIIIALAANREGDNTAEFLKKFLEPLTTKHGIRISLLGRGLSTGTEIEYSDGETLKNALKNRG